MIIPIILSGGSGTRLWPLSRKLRPKQFLPIIESNSTLFQSTLKRLQGCSSFQAPLIICNEDHRFMAAEQLRELSLEDKGILLEPVGRNTAPAIALAALYMREKDPLLLILPADHVIKDIEAFHQAILQAKKLALEGQLVTFGITPHRAETGYGYIQYRANKVLRFVEKPDQATAEHYVESQEYLWNSGMFLFKASCFLSALGKYEPTILQHCQEALKEIRNDGDFIRINEEAFATCPSISVDYAVMEKASNVSVVPLDAGWSDVGAWSAVWEIAKKDTNSNTLRGDILTHNATRNLVYSENRLVSLLGVDDLIVLDTKDAVLITHRDQVQNIKQIVEKLQETQRSEAELHREVYRPWGSYDSIDTGDRFQVKRIVVKPGAKLSLQKHFHRAEHWIVVKGTAEVRCGNTTSLLTENQSTYIPLGEIHSLTNPGKVPLEIIEVQSGSYLDEDDIVRLEDEYGRIDS